MTRHSTRWTPEFANSWYESIPWLTGCNFIPGTAINQLEMWLEETFNPETIGRELGWAAGIGFNTCRTYLHDIAWDVDAAGFIDRIDQFLRISDSHGIRPILVIFDDCWNDRPHAGPQPKPRPGVHNSGWWQSPGSAAVADLKSWNRLRDYVSAIVSRFAEDDRILMWDLYNEPGNSGNLSLPLLRETFRWARDAAPHQPLTAGLWNYDQAFQEFNEVQVTNSDIVTFHHYGPADETQKIIWELGKHGRPMICTEWMARTRGSVVETILPVFERNRVGCICWGLVSGKTNTIFPWSSDGGVADSNQEVSVPPSEPVPWFHDLLRSDGSAYDESELSAFRASTARMREHESR